MDRRETGREVRERGDSERDEDGMQWGTGEISTLTKISSFMLCMIGLLNFIYHISKKLSFLKNKQLANFYGKIGEKVNHISVLHEIFSVYLIHKAKNIWT